MFTPSPECTTAFRLPKEMLETMNRACRELDETRSQLIRRALREYLSMNELDRDMPGATMTLAEATKGNK
jgi:metal-responsive CopG/Arc/MetJ family transcriptional regulator